MTVAAAPALRIALHLLLALCLLLQGATAASMASTMALAPEAAPDAVVAGHMDRAPTVEPAQALPPCHAAAVLDAPAPDAPMAGKHGCCDAAGGLCEWACASAPTLPAALARLPSPIEPPMPHTRLTTAGPRWTTSTPLRPPIA